MKFRTLCLAALAASVALAGCNKEKTSEEINKKSMAQIYSEEGTPVNTATVKTSSFQTALSYDATVNGIYESTASAKLSDSVESVKYSVGDWVDKDAVVVTFPKDNPSANYYQAKTVYENLEATYKRMSNLYNSKGISKQDYDNAKTAYENAKATWNNVNEMVNVKAPISGLITRLDVQKTDNVKAGDILFAVTDDSKLKGKVWIQERDIARVSKGMKATATWNGAEITGKIVQLDLALNPDKKVSILICGNDPKLDRSFFVDQLSDCQVIFPDGNPAEDLCALSHCDYLMGAPSTYSLVAAMYCDVPLYWIEDAEAPLTAESFQHFDTLFRHIY